MKKIKDVVSSDEEAMTPPNSKKKLLEDLMTVMPCTCIDAYKLRKLCAPDCPYCNYADDIVELIIARTPSQAVQMDEKALEVIMHEAFFKSGLRKMNPYDAKNIKNYSKAILAKLSRPEVKGMVVNGKGEEKVTRRIRARKGWGIIALTHGTEGRFIRIFKWYIKIGD